MFESELYECTYCGKQITLSVYSEKKCSHCGDKNLKRVKYKKLDQYEDVENKLPDPALYEEES